jgi:hypothetical protein
LVALAVASATIGWALSLGASAADDASVQVAAVESDMHEFMEYVFEPTYARLQASMVTAKANSPDWTAIKSDSLILAESTNLLLGRGEATDATWQNHVQQVREVRISPMANIS